MPQVAPILEQISGMYQDYSRDALPKGKVWNMLDLLPRSRGANLRGRGGWQTRCTPLGGSLYPNVGIYANFVGANKLLFGGSSGILYEANPDGTSTTPLVNRGTIVQCAQNPFQFWDKVIFPARDGVSLAKSVTYSAGSLSIATFPASALKGAFGGVYRDRVMLANELGKEQRIAFSPIGNPLGAWDAVSFVDSSLPITGIWPLRNTILVFHAGSTEMLRGTTPPDSTLSDPGGDMTLSPFPDRAGCVSARTIAGWRENVIFADERGIYMTDGTVTADLAGQGGMSLAWRQIWQLGPTKIAAGVFGDSYVISVEVPPGQTSTYLSDPLPRAAPVIYYTFVIEIPTRSWYRLDNVSAHCFVPSQGAQQERLWVGSPQTGTVNELTKCFFPVRDAALYQVDGNGSLVVPRIETGWLPLSEPGRKRVKYVYSGYELLATTGEVAPELLLGYATELYPASFEQPITYQFGRKYPAKNTYSRRRVRFGKEADGFGFALAVSGRYSDFALYNMGVEAQPREQGALG